MVKAFSKLWLEFSGMGGMVELLAGKIVDSIRNMGGSFSSASHPPEFYGSPWD